MRCPVCVRLSATVMVLAAGAAGCQLHDPLVRRVSNEFQCEPARVNVIERHDIAYVVYDVEACGQRGRYSCLGGGRGGVYGCVHEPDPPRWDPDPAMIASVSLAPGGSEAATSSGGRRVRICGPRDDQCFFKEGGRWSWRPAPPGLYGGGCGVLCQ